MAAPTDADIDRKKLQASFDPDDPQMLAALHQHVASNYGDDWVVAGIDRTKTPMVATFARRVRGKVRHGKFKPVAGVGDAALVAADVATMYPGFTITKLDLKVGTADVAALDPLTIWCRDAVARALKVESTPWAIDVTVEVADRPARVVAVNINRFPAERNGTPEAIAKQLEFAAREVIGNAEWRVVMNHGRNTARIEWFDDPLRSTVVWAPSELASVGSVPVAVREDGSVIAPPILEANWLLGGVPGSGKSGTLTALLSSLSGLRNVALLMIDPKVVEFMLWHDRATFVATELDDAMYMLEALIDEMERRYRVLAERKLKKVSAAMLDEFPLIVVVTDELAEVTASGDTKEELAEGKTRGSRMRRLVAKGRAAGFCVIVATQRPSADLVPTSLRDLIQIRVCHATTNGTMTDIILGTGMSEFAPANMIPLKQQGVGYMLAETDRMPTRMRTMWVPDEDVAGIVENVKHLKVNLPWLAPAMAAARDAAEAEADTPRRRPAATKPPTLSVTNAKAILSSDGILLD